MISQVGRIPDICESTEPLNNVVSPLWRGLISLKDVPLDILKSFISLLESYYCKTNPNAPSRCIDGRQLNNFQRGITDLNLGPQTPGGTPILGVLKSITDILFADEGNNQNFLDDAKDVIKILIDNGINIGSHTISNPDLGMTGCGAIDNLPQVIKLCSEIRENSEHLKKMNEYIKNIIGEDYNDAITSSILDAIKVLNDNLDEYFLYSKNDQIYHYVEKLKKFLHTENQNQNHEILPELIGEHHEIAFVVNTVPGTTFNSYLFAKDSNNQIQAFNYDIHESRKICNALAVSYDLELKNENLYSFIFHAKIILSLGILMTLTDGSLVLYSREINEEGEIVWYEK